MNAHAGEPSPPDRFPEPPPDPCWRLDERGFVPPAEHDTETRLTIGNGRLGVRGALEEPSTWSRARTFVAGLFDLTMTDPPIPALVPAPNWLRVRLLLDGEPLSLDAGTTLDHLRTLDYRRGLLLRDWRYRTPNGHTIRLRTLRFVSLATRALAVQRAELTVAQPVPITFEAWIENRSAAGPRTQYSCAFDVADGPP